MAAKYCVGFLFLLQLFSLIAAAKFSVNDTYVLWNKVSLPLAKRDVKIRADLAIFILLYLDMEGCPTIYCT